MARLIGWECDKCNAQIKKEDFPDTWGKIYIEYFDGKTKEELVWCNSCIAGIKQQTPSWNPAPTQYNVPAPPQPGVQTSAEWAASRAIFSRPALTPEQLLASFPEEIPVENK